jgi:hypothetical protein
MGFDETDTSAENEVDDAPLPAEADGFISTEELPDDVRDGDASEGQEEGDE